MNKGLRILYTEILDKKKSIKSSICGSYDFRGYNDIHHIYLNWEKYDDTYSCLAIRKDRIGVYMLDGKSQFEEYKFKNN